MSKLVIGTWDFSLTGIKKAWEILNSGGPSSEAAIAVAIDAEDNPEVETVGYGGIPNRNGETELDAAVMNGDDFSVGAVLAICGYRNPSKIAERVRTHCNHNVLAGRGAEDFAVEQGFKKDILLTPAAIERWNRDRNSGDPGHDTIGAVAVDDSGKVFTATSTSGLAFKHKGRIGDSPLIGSGFYADSSVGGACATGVGEDIMRGCLCYEIVRLIKDGMLPAKACEKALLELHIRLIKSGRKVGNMAVVCADIYGNWGGCANHDNYTFAVASKNIEPHIVKVEKII